MLVLNLVLSLGEISGLSSVKERTLLFYFGIVSSLIGFIWFVILPTIKLLKKISTLEYKKLAAEVGEFSQEIKDKLINVLDLSENKSSNYSSSLTNAAIERIFNEVREVNFLKAVSYNKTKPFFILSAITIVFTASLFFISPGLRLASHKIINHATEFNEAPKIFLYVSPGNISVTKNSDVIIRVKTLGEKGNSVTILTKKEDQPSFVEQNVFPDTNGVFSLRLNSLKKSLEYYAESENVLSEIFSINVIDKPIVSYLNIDITPPKYSGLKKYSQRDNGNINSLIGSKVDVQIKSSKALASGHITFSDSSQQPLITNKINGITTFIIKNSGEYKIIVFDSTQNKNQNPVTYSIIAQKDEYPFLEVIEPQIKTKLTRSEQVLCQLKISDDFGFTNILLKHRITASSFEAPSENFTTVKINLDFSKKEQDVYYVWDVSGQMLTAGDVVSFYFEVFDNDNISGPKSTKSKLFELYIPTIEELYDEADLVQEEAVKEIEETFLEAEKLNKELEKLSNELKVDKEEITWEEKKKLEESAHKFEELKNKIEDIQKKLSKSENELEQNNLLSKETLEKYMELQELMDEMNSEEMKQAMMKLQQQMESMNREGVQKSLEEMSMNEEMFKKSLERTVNLLKRIQIEQKMDEVVKRAEDIKELTNKLEEETKNSDLSDNKTSEKLTEKQEEITKKIENLKREMEKLQEKMSQFDDMPNDEMKNLQKEADSQKNEEVSKKAKMEIQNQMKTEALKQMQMLSQNMQSTSDKLQQMQKQMQMENQLQAIYDMMKAANNLIDLSKQQEELREISENSESNQLLQNAPTQEEIMAGLEKTIKQLSELSQKTFAITPEMGKALGQAKADMMNSMNAMQSQNSSKAALSQTGAMKNLNEAATMIKGKMDQMMNGGQGGGMMSMMQQMQQLSQQQMSLNQLTQQLNKGALSPQQQGELQRLAEQQDLIRKSLEQLNQESKEAGQSKKITSNLEEILEEMEEVITKMKTERSSDELVQSQEKILSKLLDAQRSINQRDFEERRESSGGNLYRKESPEEIILSEQERENKIREELMKAIREGYSQDYEELIRKYYEAIESSKKIVPEQ